MQRAQRLAVSTATILAVALGLASCGDPAEQGLKEFGYAIPDDIVTTNAGTALGVAVDAVKVSSRLYPGAFITGPDNQLLPNQDIATVARDPRAPQRVLYTIGAATNFSDGASLACQDFLLVEIAAKNPEQFGSDMPIYNQVERIECRPNAKQFTVVFKPGFGNRYRELFAAGTILPSHIVAERAGFDDAFAAMISRDPEVLRKMGEAWQDVFRVDITDPTTVPTLGPYTIGGRGDDGQLEFIPNPEWNADAPKQDRIIMWPGRAGLKELVAQNRIAVADLPAKTDLADDGLNDPPYITERSNSTRVDALTLSTTGVFEDLGVRTAFNACIDRTAMVNSLKSKTGVTVVPASLRVVAPSHPLAGQLRDIRDANARSDIFAASDRLRGANIRIGYLENSAWYADLVDIITQQCRAAGAQITGVPLSAEDYGTLGKEYDAVISTWSQFGRNPGTDTDATADLPALRRAEETLAARMETIPLTTEPRMFAIEHHVHNVSDNTGDGGLSWNMDRWALLDKIVTPTQQQTPTTEADAPNGAAQPGQGNQPAKP